MAIDRSTQAKLQDKNWIILKDNRPSSPILKEELKAPAFILTDPSQDLSKAVSFYRSGRAFDKNSLFQLFSDRSNRNSDSPPFFAASVFSSGGFGLSLIQSEQFVPITGTETHFWSLINIMREYEFGVIDRILTQFPADDLGIQVRILLTEIDQLASARIPRESVHLFNELLLEVEVSQFRAVLNHAQVEFLSPNPSFGIFPTGEIGAALLERTKKLIERVRELREVAEWIERETVIDGNSVEKLREASLPVAQHILEKAREANRAFRASQPLKLSRPHTAQLSEEELHRLLVVSAPDESPIAAQVIDGKFIRITFQNRPEGITAEQQSLDDLIELFSYFIAAGDEMKVDAVRPGLFGIVTQEGGVSFPLANIDFDTTGLTPNQVKMLWEYLKNFNPIYRSNVLERYRIGGIDRILDEINELEVIERGEAQVGAEVIFESAHYQSLPQAEENPSGVMISKLSSQPKLFSPEKFAELASKFPQYDFERFAQEALLDPEKLRYFEDLLVRLSSIPLSSPYEEGIDLALKLKPEELAELVQEQTLLPQAARFSFGTYLGLGLNFVGFGAGVFLTPYSAYVTVKDLFDPKVDKLETLYDAGTTIVTGAGTVMAGASLAVTLMVYKLTGAVVLATGPIGWGVGLVLLGGSLAYAKEGKVEDRGARDFHEILIQNIPLREKAETLAIVTEDGDDEEVNKVLQRLKRWNPEFLNPENREAQALWRSKISGKEGEKPFAEEMRDTVKGYWIGSDDDAVSLVVLAQLMGSSEDLAYALRKVDRESYEEFRKDLPGLKSFEELSKNGLNSPSIPHLEKKTDPSRLISKREFDLSNRKTSS